jgi:hypothetical protein
METLVLKYLNIVSGIYHPLLELKGEEVREEGEEEN